jgi:hypothetical protein
MPGIDLTVVTAANGCDLLAAAPLPGMLLAQPEASGLAGVLRLQDTDGPGDWWFDLSGRTAVAAGTGPQTPGRSSSGKKARRSAGSPSPPP